MPYAAPRPCTYPLCKTLAADSGGRCADHPRAPWATSGPPIKRITGRRLQALREALFRSRPLCVDCSASGRVTLACIRDHIRPLAEGGTDTEDNVQGLCEACHTAKTLRESIRGLQW